MDALVGEIVNQTNQPEFDLTGDGFVDADDLEQWLIEAGEINLPSPAAYLPGDANLDGVVDVSDFNLWNANKFTNLAAWTAGDFTASGAVDVSDFNVWNANKFLSSSDQIRSVPEPRSVYLWVLAAVACSAICRRYSA